VADWSPATYLKFEDERTRPARDLLAQVRADRVRKVVDVGCGPGNSTELLASRYPEGEITGIDNSPAMLEEARRRLPSVRFEFADAAAWTPDSRVDLVFANATYHWIPHHLEQLTRVLSGLSAGAMLAVQMPDNTEEPTHRLMREVALARPWSAPLTGAVRDPQYLAYDVLSRAARRCCHRRVRPRHGVAALPRPASRAGAGRVSRDLHRQDHCRLFSARRWKCSARVSPPVRRG